MRASNLGINNNRFRGGNMKKLLLILSVSLVCVFIILSTGCDKDNPVDTKEMVDSGSWYETGFTPWPHDGNPYESENFMIYSDDASLEARQQLSEICEEAFARIVERLGITDLSILQFPADRDNKIHIYAYKDYAPSEWGGQAFYGGYLIYSLDNPVRTDWGHTTLDLYVPLIRHEMMHVVQTLILGNNDESYLWSWFSEGIAIEISDDIFYTRIDTQAELDDLIATYGQRNAVAIRHSWDRPNDIEGIGTYYYYPMYWLALRYMIDPQGQGGTFHDVLDVLLDGTRGMTFNNSLKNRFGISQSEFETEFFALMDEYLN